METTPSQKHSQDRANSKKSYKVYPKYYNSSMDYKLRLIEANLLPLMFWYELQDILFAIKCFIKPPDNFNLYNYVKFSEGKTRSNSSKKLVFKFSRTNTTRHFYLSRLVKLWNNLPLIDLSLPFSTTKQSLYNHFWTMFHEHFDPADICSYHIDLVCPCSADSQYTLR